MAEGGYRLVSAEGFYYKTRLYSYHEKNTRHWSIWTDWF